MLQVTRVITCSSSESTTSTRKHARAGGRRGRGRAGPEQRRGRGPSARRGQAGRRQVTTYLLTFHRGGAAGAPPPHYGLQSSTWPLESARAASELDRTGWHRAERDGRDGSESARGAQGDWGGAKLRLTRSPSPMRVQISVS